MMEAQELAENGNEVGEITENKLSRAEVEKKQGKKENSKL